MKRKNGFTLVELVVTALLLAILALGAFTFLNAYTNSARETSAFLKMQRWSDGLMDEVARQVRRSNLILPCSTASFNLNTAIINTSKADTSRGVVLCTLNLAGDTVVAGGYWFDTLGVVRECIPTSDNKGCGWRNFSIDADSMKMCYEAAHPHATNPLDKVNNRFIINSGKNEVTVNVTFKTIAHKVPFHLNVERGVFKCRVRLEQ